MNFCHCGADAGKFQQHWNRDTGWGVCKSCVNIAKRSSTPEEIKSMYGTAGVNYEADTYTLHGRVFNVVVSYPDTPEGQEHANRYMVLSENSALLAIDGRIILADKRDKGTPVVRERESTNEH